MSRRIVMVLCCLVMVLSAAPAMAKDFQVGFIYVSPIGDAGWSYAHDQGRLFIDKLDGVSTSYVEAVPEGPDSERVMLNMARKNYDLIFATSFGYMDPMLKVAEKFPEHHLHALLRVQNRRQHGQLLRADVPGPLPVRHGGRRHDQIQHAGLCGRLPHSGSHPGHQCLYLGCPGREPQGAGAGGLDQNLV